MFSWGLPFDVFIRFVVCKKITSSFSAKKLFLNITLTFIGLFN